MIKKFLGIILCIVLIASCKLQSFEDFESEYIHNHYDVDDIIETYENTNIKMYLLKKNEKIKLVFFEEKYGNYNVEEITAEDYYGSFLYSDAFNTFLIIFYDSDKVNNFSCSVVKNDNSIIQINESNLQNRQQHIFYYVLDRDYQLLQSLSFK
ncbi:hypothetical protein HF861_03255 [Faecalicoccus pleomorphus]|uniref:Lipoprotein n=1 Tax=Faecalicoccus pleomorphus TaxID=1323 RepID=A0A7X9RJ59_9FIRM|nr:hypothetical protein [Faecalicoccus pleomorphus]NME43899.1 hypothetical protein [Faecalicoccus pleomorphus]